MKGNLKEIKSRLAQLSDNQKSALYTKLQQGKQSEAGKFPLTATQKLFYFHHKYQPTLCNIPVAIKIAGYLNVKNMEAAINKLLLRHEALRTSIIEEDGGNVSQIVNKNVAVALQKVDISSINPALKDSELRNLIGAFFKHPFYFTEQSLMRVLLVQLKEKEFVLALCIHHIIADGWSLGLILQDLISYYEAAQGYSVIEPKSILFQYSDYVAWLDQPAQQQRLKDNLQFWKEELQGANTILQLPTDYPRPKIRKGYGSTKTLTLPIDFSIQIRTFCLQRNVTLFIFFLSVFSVILNRYTGERDILIGSPVSIRDLEPAEKLVGVFLNFLVFRIGIEPGRDFLTLLNRVRKVALDAYEHNQCSFYELIKAIKPQKDPSFTSLFQVFIAHNNAPIKTHKCADLMLSPMLEEAGGADADLALFYADADEAITLRIEYSTELFKEDTINAFFKQISTVISEIIINPEQPVNKLKILTKQDEHQLLKFSNFHEPQATDKNIFYLLNKAIQSFPNDVALSDNKRKLTYSDLPIAVDILIEKINSYKLKKCSNVLVLLDNSIELVLAMLAIFQLGLRYVPLGPCIKRSYLNEVLEDSEAKLIISADNIDIEANLLVISEIYLKVTSCKRPKYFSETNIKADDIAYLIYTSGTTGKPKASLNLHEGLYARMNWWRQQNLKIVRGKSITTLAPTFDVSIWGILGSLVYGSELFCVTNSDRLDIEILAQDIFTQQVSFIITVPQILKLLLSFNTFLENTTHLKVVVVAGDILLKDTVEKFYNHFSAKLFNGYGPSETCILVTCSEIQKDIILPAIPIGSPIADSQIFILNDANLLQPINIPGEIYIGGKGVAQGYLKRNDLNSEKFIQSPFHHTKQKLYKTGDKARWLPDGQIEFLGRIDTQIKFNGIRLEAEAIENLIQKFPGIKQAVVVLREDMKDDKRLHGFIVSDAVLNRDALRAFLQQHLSQAIIPNFFHQLKSIPVNTNGKIDRKKLSTHVLADLLEPIQEPILAKQDTKSVSYYTLEEDIIKDTKLDSEEFNTGKIVFISNCRSNLLDEFSREIYSKNLADRVNITLLDFNKENFAEIFSHALEKGNLTYKEIYFYLCSDRLNTEEMYQSFFYIKDLFTHFAGNPTCINFLMPFALDHGLYNGLLKTFHTEYADFSYRYIVIKERQNQEFVPTVNFLNKIQNLSVNKIYYYNEGVFYNYKLIEHFVPQIISGISILRPQGTYLITGGTGGIGSSIANFIAEKVKCNLILITRQKQLNEQQIKLQLALRDKGCNVEIYTVDVADQLAVNELAKDIHKRYGSITGLIHAAGYVEFGLLKSKTAEQISKVLKPKFEGTIFLYDAFHADHYDFFINFSSTVTESVFPGIADYVIANEFLDGFVCHKHHKDKKPIKAIKWGMWKEVGMSTPDKIINKTSEYLEHWENFAMTTEEALAAFDKALVISEPIVYISKEVFRKARTEYINNNFDVANVKPSSMSSEAVENIKKIWQSTLNIQNVDIDADFFELGGHSLLALQLINRLNKELNIKFKLHDIFARPTIRKLSATFEKND